MIDVGFGAQDCKPSLKPKPVYVGLGALSYFAVLGRGFGLRDVDILLVFSQSRPSAVLAAGLLIGLSASHGVLSGRFQEL